LQFEVEIHGNSKLERLILANNSITDLASILLQDLPNLTNLHLEDNKISAISDKDFLGLKQSAKLVTLIMDGNNISWIGCRAFESLPNLVILSMQRNKITSLSCSSSRDPFGNLHLFIEYLFYHPNNFRILCLSGLFCFGATQIPSPSSTFL
jgi:Leucine-rich repeat (LRR) protein